VKTTATKTAANNCRNRHLAEMLFKDRKKCQGTTSQLPGKLFKTSKKCQGTT